MLSERDVHSSFHCSQPFGSPFRCSWWFGRTQNKATTRQPGIFVAGPVAWNSLPYIINVQKHAQDTSVLSFLLHWLTVSRVRAANIVRRPCSDSLAMLLLLINRRCIIIIIIIIIFLCPPAHYYYYYYYYYYKEVRRNDVQKYEQLGVYFVCEIIGSVAHWL